MACIEVFEEYNKLEDGKSSGRIVRYKSGQKKGNIKEVVMADGSPSIAWQTLKSLDVDKARKNPFDKKYMAGVKTKIEANGGSFDISNDTDVRYAMYTKLFTSSFREAVHPLGNTDSDLDENIVEKSGDIELLDGTKASLLGAPDFNIKALVENSKEVLAAFEARLDSDPKFVRAVLKRYMGKAYSADAQSQLLSAATDNAKELILGRIGANEHTNGIITAMLIMGYDLDVIIDFLQDTDIQKILAKAQDNKNSETYSPFTQSQIKKYAKSAGISNKSPSLESLLKISEVSSSIMAFGGIRSLSENFQIDSFKLDSILDSVDADGLYEVITNPDKSLEDLYGPKNRMEVFDAQAIIYYHPQSRSIFKRLYELERNILPGMFKSRSKITDFVGSWNRNDAAYKGALGYMAKLQVDSFFKQKDPETGKILTGTLFDEKGKKVNFKLDSAAGREKFIEAFPDFVKRMQSNMKIMGMSNLAVASLRITPVKGSLAPMVSIPAYKSGIQDDFFKGAIEASVEELTTFVEGVDTEGTMEMKKVMYSGLMLYSLITSGGQMSKNSMIELFPEINTDFAHFINTLTDENFYNRVLGMETNEDGEKTDLTKYIAKSIVFDKLKDVATIRRKAAKEAAALYDEDVIGVEAPVKGSPAYKRVMTVPVALRGHVYKDSEISGALFFGSTALSAPMRIFDSANPLSSPAENAKPPSIENRFKKGKMVGTSQLLDYNLKILGKQIGYGAKLRGKDVRVLSYKGMEQVKNGTGVDLMQVYNVLGSDGNFIQVPGIVLMEENPRLGLHYNVIGPMTPSVNSWISKSSGKHDAKIIAGFKSGEIKAKKAVLSLKYQVILSEDIQKEFKDRVESDMTNTSVIVELGMLSSLGNSAAIIGDSKDAKRDEGRGSMYSRIQGFIGDEFDASQPRFFVPSIDVYEKGIVEASVKTRKTEKLEAEVIEKIENILSGLLPGESKEFAINSTRSKEVYVGTGKSIMMQIHKKLDADPSKIFNIVVAGDPTTTGEVVYTIEKIDKDLAALDFDFTFNNAEYIADISGGDLEIVSKYDQRYADKSRRSEEKPVNFIRSTKAAHKGKPVEDGGSKSSENAVIQAKLHAIANKLDGGMYSDSAAIIERFPYNGFKLPFLGMKVIDGDGTAYHFYEIIKGINGDIVYNRVKGVNVDSNPNRELLNEQIKNNINDETCN